MSSVVLVILCIAFQQCKDDKPQTTAAAINSLELKRGEIVSCSPPGADKYGNVSFIVSVPPALRTDFNTAVALLYSFEYKKKEKMFAKIIDGAPDCAMACQRNKGKRS